MGKPDLAEMEPRWCYLLVAIATICVAGASEVQSLTPEEMDPAAHEEQRLVMCQSATKHALEQITSGKVVRLDATSAFRAAEKAVEQKDYPDAEDENKPSQTVVNMEKVAQAQEAAVSKDNKEMKKKEDETEAAVDLELLGTTYPKEGSKAKAKEAKEEESEQNMEDSLKLEEATAKRLALKNKLNDAPDAVVELGEDGFNNNPLETPLIKCRQAAVKAISEAMKQKQRERRKQTESQKAINAVEDKDAAETAQSGGTPLEQAKATFNKANAAIANAASPLELTVAEAEGAEAGRFLKKKEEEEENNGGPLKPKSVATTEKVASSKGTVAKAAAADKALKQAKTVEDTTENAFVAKTEAESATVTSAQQAAKAPANMVVHADQVVEKEVKGVMNGTPQTAVAAAANAEQASKALERAVFKSAPAAEVKKLEAEAVTTAKQVTAAQTSAATVVAEVKADDAAKTAEKNPTRKNEAKMVAATEQIQNPQQDTPDVKAVKLTRELAQQEKTKKDKAAVAETAEEKKMLASAGGLILAKVLKAGEKPQPTVEKPQPTEQEIIAKIKGAPNLAEESKKNRISAAVTAVAEGGGAVGNMLKKIIEAKDMPNMEGMSAREKDKAKKELNLEASNMFQEGQKKPKNEGEEEPKEEDKALVKEEEEIEKKKIPAEGFQEDKEEESEKQAEKEIEKEEGTKTSEAEKVGEGIVIEGNNAEGAGTEVANAETANAEGQ